MIYLFISVVIFVLDFIVKKNVEEKLEYNKSQSKWKNRILVRKVYNKGGALNTLDQNQEFVAGFSAALTFSILIAQLYLIGKKGFHFLKLGFSLLIGGACSNVYDRMVRKYVVDYFSFNTKIKKIREIVFNISDMFIFIGSAIVTLFMMFQSEKKIK